MGHKRRINKSVEFKTNLEETYHKSRIMFAFINDELKYSLNDKRDHQKWLEEDYNIDKEEFETLIRGYIKDFTVVIYKSSSFLPLDYSELTKERIEKLIDLCRKTCKPGNYKFYTGVHIGNVGEIWKPIKSITDFDIK